MLVVQHLPPIQPLLKHSAFQLLQQAERPLLLQLVMCHLPTTRSLPVDILSVPTAEPASPRQATRKRPALMQLRPPLLGNLKPPTANLTQALAPAV